MTAPHASSAAPRLVPVGTGAVMVELAEEVDDAAHARVVALDRQLAASPPAGVREVVPAYVTLLVAFDPFVTDHGEVAAALRELLARPAQDAPPSARHVVQVCYDPAFGTDLDAVAYACDLGVEAVVHAHLAGDYRVVMYGFAPGYAYLSGVDPAIRLPRKPTPVRGVPAGSVIVAGPQCLVTTLDMPAGWWVLGRSPTRVLRPEDERPFLLDPGDEVTFERIDRATYDRLVRGR